MTFVTLLIHDWKKGIRAHGFYKNIAVNLFLALFVIYFAAIMLFIGFSLDLLLIKLHPKLSPLESFNGSLLYLILSSLLFRFFLQPLSSFNLSPYQLLPIKRKSIINFLLIKPLLSVANYFSLFVIIPFSVQYVSQFNGTITSIRLILCYIFIIWFNSLTINYIKRKIGTNLFSILFLIGLLGGLAALDEFGLFSLFDTSLYLFNIIIGHPYGLTIPIIAVISIYIINQLFFWRNYYTEKFYSKEYKKRIYIFSPSLLDRFGTIGELINLELKLIFRHKRTKSLLILTSVFLFYGLVFYTNEIYTHNHILLFFVALFETGLFLFTCGQWIISWDSSFFDRIMTANIKTEDYIKSNYYLLLGFNIISFILTTPYFYFGSSIMLQHLVAFIYNTGANIYFLIFLAIYNARKIEMDKKGTINYQGTSFKGFLIMIPMMIIPLLVMWLSSIYITLEFGMWTLTFFGATCALFHKQIIKALVHLFNNQKHLLSEAFRESEN
jgi:hypothetical protein